MEKGQLRYSAEELKEFEELLSQKIAKTEEELSHLMSSIKKSSSGQDDNHENFKSMDDGSDVLEKEQLNQLAARTQKYLSQLKNAMVRIKNGTYGICIDTGKLIPKERLRAVPHTQHSIEAKMSKVN